jgi:hypothetical protein
MLRHMGLRVLCASLLVVAVCLVAMPRAEAQVLYGSLVGNVIDSTGAVVPNATVTITHRGTNQSRTTVAGSAGAYNFATIPTGAYTLQVEQAGFAPFQIEVQVSINTVSRVDVTLQLGTVAETVLVTGEAVTLQTDRAEVRSDIPSRALENLPVPLGRNYQHLLRTVPGIRPPNNAHSVPTNPARALQFNVNGVSSSINNTRIDGASSTNIWLPHIVAFVPTLEAIETINIVTNSFDAEQGLAGGAAVNLQIKSGTNQFRGSAFHYHSSNRLKAKPFFLPQGRVKPKFIFNEPGATLGGPIKKDRVFFFVSYEGTFQNEFADRILTVPTAQMRAGDYSASPRVVYDPLTGNELGQNRLAFPDNKIPAARLSPISQKIAALIPLPNLPMLNPANPTNNYYAGFPFSFARNRVDSKVNWTVNNRLSTFGRFSLLDYSMDNPESLGPAGGVEISGFGGNPGIGSGRTYSFTGAATYVITPRLVMDAYYGYTRMDTSVEQPRLDEKIGLDVLGIPGTNGARRFEGGMPAFRVGGFANVGISNDFMPYTRRDPQYQYVANFSYTRGNHEVRFGTDFYNQHMNHLQPEASAGGSAAPGRFDFGTGPTSLRVGTATQPTNQFNNYATFMLGLPTFIGKNTQVPDEYTTRARMYSFYVRDRWNVSRKLTLSYGTRWEHFPFPTRHDRGMERYDPATNTMLVCGVGSVPKNCGVTETKMRFAPRFGFAYRATDTFVIRAGYGITWDPFSLARPFRTNYPLLIIQSIPSPQAWLWAGELKNGIPPAQVPSFGDGRIAIPGTYVAFTASDQYRRGYVQSWNFTLQKDLGWGFVGQAGYVANRSVRNNGYLDLNAGQVIGAGNNGQPLRILHNRTAATFLVTPMGTNQYDSLQASLERRFRAGLQLGLGYTWSKAIGITENSDNQPRVRALQYFHMNRALQNYDRTHNMQITNIWEVPLGKGHRWASGGVAAAILGGWQVNNVVSLNSGTPFSISGGGSLNMPGTSQRGDQINGGKVPKIGDIGSGTRWFDTSWFANTVQGTQFTEQRFGNAHYNSMRGPGIVNWDFGVFRQFRLTERFGLQFRGEAFNFSNTPKFSNPNGDTGSTNFGAITGQPNLGREGINERQFRVGLRLNW